ncbi:uncharacterized protein LOC129580448 [Sitodiplosis mosellana]|uniref:uncharacterized protein LOC129580448 n=1 Tax=Sitodiplosis mosellana TaxID=263140 RepID=UPI00244525BE|nr:uncharacterized protein LOC129580448 [Sitodiplosis mosellana]
MAKVFVPETDKWGVKISIDRRRITRSSSTQSRRIVIHNPRSLNSSNRNEKWHADLKKFIADSKKEIDFQATNLIEAAKKWQRNANEKFDMLQQHINREHNLQNSSTTTNDEERPTERPIERRTERQIERPTGRGRPRKTPTERSTKEAIVQPKKVCFPSMPVLITDTVDAVDDLSEFLTEPPAALPSLMKKIAKRRSTVCVSSPESERASIDVPVPIQKVSRTELSSVLAEPGTPKSANKPKEQASNTTGASNSLENQAPIREEQPITSAQKKDDIFRKFLETREIVLARKKQRDLEEAARANDQSKED